MRGHCIGALLFLFASSYPAGAMSQTLWGNVFAATSCDTWSVEIQVDMIITGAVPAELVGWVVDRAVVGACASEVQVGGVRAFEAGENSYFVVDLPEIADCKTIYHVRAVDAQGRRHWISWPQRTHFTQADCVGGPAARGTVTEVAPGYFHLNVCPDSCWWELSMFDDSLPSEAPSLVGQVINVYGEIISGMEGPYIDVAGWDYPGEGCEKIVPTHESSWSVLKLRYSGK